MFENTRKCLNELDEINAEIYLHSGQRFDFLLLAFEELERAQEKLNWYCPETPLHEKRMYTSEQAEIIKKGIVICDMAQRGECDGKPCGGRGCIPHVYEDMEDFSECCHEGKNGLSVPAIGKVQTQPM